MTVTFGGQSEGHFGGHSEGHFWGHSDGNYLDSFSQVQIPKSEIISFRERSGNRVAQRSLNVYLKHCKVIRNGSHIGMCGGMNLLIAVFQSSQSTTMSPYSSARMMFHLGIKDSLGDQISN